MPVRLGTALSHCLPGQKKRIGVMLLWVILYVMNELLPRSNLVNAFTLASHPQSTLECA